MELVSVPQTSSCSVKDVSDVEQPEQLDMLNLSEDHVNKRKSVGSEKFLNTAKGMRENTPFPRSTHSTDDFVKALDFLARVGFSMEEYATKKNLIRILPDVLKPVLKEIFETKNDSQPLGHWENNLKSDLDYLCFLSHIKSCILEFQKSTVCTDTSQSEKLPNFSNTCAATPNQESKVNENKEKSYENDKNHAIELLKELGIKEVDLEKAKKELKRKLLDNLEKYASELEQKEAQISMLHAEINKMKEEYEFESEELDVKELEPEKEKKELETNLSTNQECSYELEEKNCEIKFLYQEMNKLKESYNEVLESKKMCENQNKAMSERLEVLKGKTKSLSQKVAIYDKMKARYNEVLNDENRLTEKSYYKGMAELREKILQFEIVKRELEAAVKLQKKTNQDLNKEKKALEVILHDRTIEKRELEIQVKELEFASGIRNDDSGPHFDRLNRDKHLEEARADMVQRNLTNIPICKQPLPCPCATNISVSFDRVLHGAVYPSTGKDPTPKTRGPLTVMPTLTGVKRKPEEVPGENSNETLFPFKTLRSETKIVSVLYQRREEATTSQHS